MICPSPWSSDIVQRNMHFLTAIASSMFIFGFLIKLFDVLLRLHALLLSTNLRFRDDNDYNGRVSCEYVGMKNLLSTKTTSN